MSFFHEAWHLLNDRRGDRLTLDIANDADRGALESNEREIRAERFAREILVPQKVVDDLIVTGITRDAIRNAAEDLGVGPDIVLGRLQRAGGATWSDFSGMHRRFTWADP
jgi:Zn-dependent peptidase ImmA (M78 family)